MGGHISPDIDEEVLTVTLSLLPKKSREKYEKEFNFFLKWCKERGIKNHTKLIKS